MGRKITFEVTTSWSYFKQKSSQRLSFQKLRIAFYNNVQPPKLTSRVDQLLSSFLKRNGFIL